ncbi:MAG TPA: iron-sulfur cluster assembly protein, partial [Gemmatimonadales bacterium]|nr:iron-sulfur cluster assembly protein [Gemmatimonadales bacterium]
MVAERHWEGAEAAVARGRAALDAVMDPEVPVLSIVELGIVRGVSVEEDGRTVRVILTPTYSGCPAMHAIEA